MAQFCYVVTMHLSAKTHLYA